MVFAASRGVLFFLNRKRVLHKNGFESRRSAYDWLKQYNIAKEHRVCFAFMYIFVFNLLLFVAAAVAFASGVLPFLLLLKRKEKSQLF